MTIKDMNRQIITSPSGERLVVIPEDELNALIGESEDAADVAIVRAFRDRLAAGDEELVPAEVANRFLDGENPIRVWREYRGVTPHALAKEVGISAPYLSQIETGKREGTVKLMRRIADVLNVQIDDLVG
jgi:DNA-binding XRE family transcriptional regulator